MLSISLMVHMGVKESMAESYGDCHVAEKWYRWLPKGALVILQGCWRRNARSFTQDRLCMAKSHILR